MKLEIRILSIGFAALLLVFGAVPASGASAPQENGNKETSAKSLKERLSDKASDEQRVDNCRVPLDRRGSKPRPDCPPAPQAGKPVNGNPAGAIAPETLAGGCNLGYSRAIRAGISEDSPCTVE
jgi:hypothetical protein